MSGPPVSPAVAFVWGAIVMTLPAAVVVAAEMPRGTGLITLGCAMMLLTLIPLAFERRG